jgi:ADP-ribose pyrophosphatase
MKPWKTLSREKVLDLGKFLVVEKRAVELPDGRVIANWPWIITPDYINVVTITEEGKFLCFRQTKYSVEGTSLAPVGGYLEPDEDPLAAAKRELLEEAGCIAPEWINLGRYAVDGNRGAGVANFFCACGARRVQDRDADDLEEQELLLLSRAEIEMAVARGEFKVLAWQAIMALGLLYLDRRPKFKEETMPEFKRFPKTRVAYVTESGPFQEAIPRGFQKLFAWLGARNLQPLGPSLGIFHDDPAKVPAEKLRSELCVPVAPQVQSAGEVQVKELAEFEAATIVYQGNANIMPAYNEVYDWLRAQGYRDAGPVYEVYLSKPGEELRAQVYVPIAKAAKPVAQKRVTIKPAKKPARKVAKKVAKKRAQK